MKERFWAKTGKNEFKADKQPEYHPVICHLADTAAVAMELVRNGLSPIALKTLEKGLGLSGEALVRCCGFFAGSHDLGKVSPAFQFQVDEVGKALAGSELYDLWHKLPQVRRAGKAPHGLVTARTLPEFLIELGLDERLAKKLSTIVGGHHGFFPLNKDILKLDEPLAGVNEGNNWRQFSREIFEQLWQFAGLTPQDLPKQCDNAAAMILAGLTTVSDWIASNPDRESGFPYANDTLFEEYAADLPHKAKRALNALGWTKLPTGKPLRFSELFPGMISPRPLQSAAMEMAESLTAPCLVLIEASMGEGKTETALFLADHLQQQAATGGFYIGLPTQATSNAMFERVEKFLTQRYPKEQFPDLINLTLSHSAAALKPEYQASMCRLDQVYDEDRRVVAREWHMARKRTLLSPYGVGTLDQALMGVVRSRHQFVRLFGLAGRTVILDEIHAYELYTSILIERFVEWLALLGSPVVALSATLPTETRRNLLNAYAEGCGCPQPELPMAEYPRLTTFTPQGVSAKSFAASPHVIRSLNLRWVKDAEWAEALQEQLAGDGCAAVICSTVGRAQEVFQRLQEYFPKGELGLFHGRFLFVDRDRIEKDCLASFGKTGQRPKRYVLVATQVIEQSLDVDFDLMISDLAPVDLLLQRSGRLHRHEREHRPAQLAEPTMWLIAPNLDDHSKVQFAEAGFIYDRHVLLRSWLAMRDRTSVQLPDMMDDLIESVYDLGRNCDPNLEAIYAEDWQTSLGDYHIDLKTRKGIAQKVRVPPATKDNKPEHFTRQGDEDGEDAVAAMTRLGKKSVTTIFLQQTAQGLVFPGSEVSIDLEQPPNLDTIRSLLEHSTRISNEGLVEELLRQEIPKRWTSALLRNCRHVVLNEQSEKEVGKWKLELDSERGVLSSEI